VAWPCGLIRLFLVGGLANFHACNVAALAMAMRFRLLMEYYSARDTSCRRQGVLLRLRCAAAGLRGQPILPADAGGAPAHCTASARELVRCLWCCLCCKLLARAISISHCCISAICVHHIDTNGASPHRVLSTFSLRCSRFVLQVLTELELPHVYHTVRALLCSALICRRTGLVQHVLLLDSCRSCAGVCVTHARQPC